MSSTETRLSQAVNVSLPHARFVWPLLALLACLASLVVIFSGFFTVRQVDIVGNNLPRGAIVQAAGVNGQNIFTVRSDGVVARLDTVPEVVVQRVETSFPNRVTIYARARLPMVAWQQTGGGLFLLDPNGRVISQVSTTNLPVITGTAPGSKLGPGIVAAVRYAVQELPREPRGAIQAFRFNPDNGLTIVGRAGWTADVGRGSPRVLMERIGTLAGFLYTIRNRPQQLKYVDLRYHGAYATFAGG